MKSGQILLCLLLSFVLSPVLFAQAAKTYKIRTVAFYNVENLFDTFNDPLTFDDDRTPKGKDHWTEEIYRDKLKKIAFAIRNIGAGRAGNPPVIVGLCEIENRKVLEDLIQEPVLAEHHYGIVHYESPDRRGIDVALLYQTQFFIPVSSKAHELIIYDSYEPKKRVYTRDQLVVSGLLEGEELHFIVNHWPSRSGGASGSSYKREKAATLNREIIDSLQQMDPYAKIMSLGDFNDDPFDKSLEEILGASPDREDIELKDLYNPMAGLAQQGIGSLAFRDGWNLFDQIILSQPLLEEDYSSYRFYQARIANENYLVTPTGQYKGYPFRSFGFGGYTGGYSDHFPVYVFLIKEAKAKE